MAPAAAALTDTSTHHQHIDNATIRHVHVIPVIQTGTHNYHTATMCFMCVLGKFACHLNHQLRLHAGMFLLPHWCIRHISQIIIGNTITTKTTINTIIGTHQIKYCGYQYFFAIYINYLLNRYIFNHYFCCIIPAEVIKRHTHDGIMIIFK